MIWPFGVKPTTFVSMRDDDVPVKYWVERVRYDDWGRPYVTDGDRLMPFVVRLMPDGSTDRHQVVWKMKSGPEIEFPKIDRSKW